MSDNLFTFAFTTHDLSIVLNCLITAVLWYFIGYYFGRKDKP